MKMSYREAIRQAMHEALAADPRVFLMGEDVGKYGGTYACSKGFLEEFGPERIRDTPLSELGFVGAGIGAALGGMRPIVEVMTVNFSLLALDLENWYAHIPGIKVLAPATIADARGMLGPALADPDPVVIFEHAQLYNMEGDLPDDWRCDIATAAVRRAGTDISLITYGGSLPKTLAAADQLAAEGIAAEVIDLRVLRPLDTATLAASLRKTHKAVVVDEGWKSGSLAAEVMARIVEDCFFDLDAPVARVCSEEVPIPYARHMEEAALPQTPKIVAAAKQVLGKA